MKTIVCNICNKNIAEVCSECMLKSQLENGLLQKKWTIELMRLKCYDVIKYPEDMEAIERIAKEIKNVS